MVPPSTAPGRSWPFTGRDAELRAVASALERDGAVVVAGVAGVGKSRLARELVGRLVPDDRAAVATATASARDIPLGAFAPWLNGHDATAGNGDAPVSALARVAATLRAGGPRTILLVDDAHMLDATSATLLHELAMERAVRVVATVRTGERCPDAVTALWKDGAATRIEIPPMDERATTLLLRSVLGGHLDARGARRLHEVTLGNVLWLRHIVEGEIAAGRLALSGSGWEWDGDPVLSPALEHLIDARIGTLDEQERRVLDLVALGEPLGLTMLTTLADAEAVERMAERGLVAVETDGLRTEVRLGHPLYGEAARGHLSIPRARRMRGELSRALSGTGNRRAGDELRRAVLDLDSDIAKDPALLTLSASQAMGLTDFVLAERLLRAAVDAGGGFDAQLSLAFLLGWQLRTEETVAALARAMDMATTGDDRMRAFLVRVQMLFFVLDRREEGLAAIEAEEVHSPGRPETAVCRMVLRAVGGDVAAGVRDALALLDSGIGSPQVLSWTCWAASYVLALQGGDSERVRTIVARGMDAARLAPETAVMLGNIGFGELIDALYAGTPEVTQDRLAWVRQLTGSQSATWSGLFEGSVAVETGRPRTAARLLESVLTSFPGHGGGWSSWLHGRLAQAHAMLGETTAAAASVDTAVRVHQDGILVFDGEVTLARAWIAAARGARHEAVGHAVSLAEDSHRRGAYAAEVAARHVAVRLGDREQADALGALARRLGTPRAAATSAHARALASRDAGGLLEAADALEACDLVLAAADAAAQAAVIAREQGRLPAAASAVEQAERLAASCEGARTPALEAARAPLPISIREREVAILAAEGLTNREIAARLHVSVRTVESHVYRACSRLGVPDRASLAAAVVGRTVP
ncbi:helix-turn-helix transcriptional regulator [Actinomycetospora aeridis]|uniref:LuxR C-terminal-related transcriptional regulator n=1 Tax=Actinomycetospora aeridis TaxID=3129231 RepID=A0ABU8NDH7_9PSEU